MSSQDENVVLKTQPYNPVYQRNIERMDVLPPTQIFMCEEFDKCDDNLECMKDRELAVEDLPSTQPFVPESFNSSIDNAKVDESENPHNAEKMNSGASQEFEFNLSKVKVEPIEPSPDDTSHARQFDYNALEAKAETIGTSPPQKPFSYARSSPREVDYEAHEAKVEVLDDYRDLQEIKKSSVINMMKNSKSNEKSDTQLSYNAGCKKFRRKTKSYRRKTKSLKILIKDANKKKVGFKQHCCEILRKSRAIARKYRRCPEFRKLIRNGAKRNLNGKRQNVEDGQRIPDSKTPKCLRLENGKKKESSRKKKSEKVPKRAQTGKTIVWNFGAPVQDGHSPGQNAGSETGKKIVMKVGEHVENGSRPDEISANKTEEDNTIKADEHDMNVDERKQDPGEVNIQTGVETVEERSSPSQEILTSKVGQESRIKSDDHEDGYIPFDKISTSDTAEESVINADEHVDVPYEETLTSEIPQQSMIKADEHVQDLQSSSGEKSASETQEKRILKVGEEDLYARDKIEMQLRTLKVSLIRLEDTEVRDKNAARKSEKAVEVYATYKQCVKKKKKGQKVNAANSLRNSNTENRTVRKISKATVPYNLRRKVAEKICQCCGSSKSQEKYKKYRKSQTGHNSWLQTSGNRECDSLSEIITGTLKTTGYNLRKRSKFSLDMHNKMDCKFEYMKSIKVSKAQIKKIISRNPVVCIERLKQSVIDFSCKKKT